MVITFEADSNGAGGCQQCRDIPGAEQASYPAITLLRLGIASTSVTTLPAQTTEGVCAPRAGDPLRDRRLSERAGRNAWGRGNQWLIGGVWRVRLPAKARAHKTLTIRSRFSLQFARSAANSNEFRPIFGACQAGFRRSFIENYIKQALHSVYQWEIFLAEI